MVTADHGPAVSGAHNTIVCARAGKDLVSSLTSGLLTIVRSVTVNTTTALLTKPVLLQSGKNKSSVTLISNMKYEQTESMAIFDFADICYQ